MNIVLVGDSHSDSFSFATGLKAALEAQGHKLTILSIGGSAAFQWAGSKPVCRKGKPCASINDVSGQKFDLALVALGTNDAANANKSANKNPAKRKPLLQKVIKDIETIGTRLAPRMMWIGPPKMNPGNDKKKGIFTWYTNDAMNALYEVGLSYFGDRAIDSRTLMPATLGGDGIHLGAPAYKTWSSGVAKIIGGAAPASVASSTVESAPTDAPTPEAEGGSNLPMIVAAIAGLAVIYFMFFRNPIPQATRVMTPIPTPEFNPVSGLAKRKRRNKKAVEEE